MKETVNHDAAPFSWRKRWSNRTLACIGAAVVVVAALWAARVQLSPEAIKQALSPSPTLPRGDASPPAPSVAIPVTETVPLHAIETSISPTPQRLVLTGTILGRNGAEGLALIGIDEHSPQTYAAGALLANGVRITQITEKYVVLERDGVSTHLYLNGERGTPAVSRARESLLLVGGASLGKAATATSSELLTDFIRPTPIYDGEVLKGYQVYPGANAGAFGQLGLQPGDVITTVNGAPFASAEQAVELLRQLTEGIAMTATIQRNGKAVTVPLDGAVINTALEHASRAQAGAEASSPPPI